MLNRNSAGRSQKRWNRGDCGRAASRYGLSAHSKSRNASVTPARVLVSRSEAMLKDALRYAMIVSYRFGRRSAKSYWEDGRGTVLLGDI
jgi:hypothetical protein